MSDHAITAIVAVLIAITGVAILAELVSSRSQTGSVLKAGGSGLSTALCVALSPLTGGGCNTSVSSTITFGGSV